MMCWNRQLQCKTWAWVRGCTGVKGKKISGYFVPFILGIWQNCNCTNIIKMETLWEGANITEGAAASLKRRDGKLLGQKVSLMVECWKWVICTLFHPCIIKPLVCERRSHLGLQLLTSHWESVMLAMRLWWDADVLGSGSNQQSASFQWTWRRHRPIAYNADACSVGCFSEKGKKWYFCVRLA